MTVLSPIQLHMLISVSPHGFIKYPLKVVLNLEMVKEGFERAFCPKTSLTKGFFVLRGKK